MRHGIVFFSPLLVFFTNKEYMKHIHFDAGENNNIGVKSETTNVKRER